MCDGHDSGIFPLSIQTYNLQLYKKQNYLGDTKFMGILKIQMKMVHDFLKSS